MQALRLGVLLLLAVAGIGLLLVTSGISPAFAQGRPASVLTDLTDERQVSETVPVFGQIVASKRSVIASRVAGIVLDVKVEVGDRIEAGRPIAMLDQELLLIQQSVAEAAEREAQAGLDVAEAGLELSRQVFERIQGLRETPSFSKGQFEDLRSQVSQTLGQLAQAEARVLRAKADLARAHYDLENTTIKAPFHGVVLEVQAQPGQYITTGAPVITLLDVDSLEIEANVPAEYVGSLSKDQVLTAVSDTAQVFDVHVRALIPREAVQTRTRPVRFEADMKGLAASKGKQLALGQSVTVQVPISQSRDVVTVAKDALVQARGGWMVFVPVEGKAEPRQIQIGAAIGDRFEVLSGLEAGMPVVVRGNERLRPGQDVAPIPADASAAAPPEKSPGEIKH